MNVLTRLQEFLTQTNQIKAQLKALGFKMNQANLREMYRLMVSSYVTDYDKNMLSFDDTVNNNGYQVPLRIYLPDIYKATNLPVAVYLHGGGHVVGDVSVYDGPVRMLTKQINHIVISVDYRLAPEFPYPTAINDCKSVITHAFDLLNSLQIGYLNQELTIIGDSAGGALCASIVMDKKFTTQNKITKQVLIYPSLDYTGSFESYNTFGVGYLLEKPKIEWYFNQYFQHGEDRKQASPLYSEFYPQLPKTLVLVASHDLLHDEGVAYYNKLRTNQVEAELLQIDGVLHGFLLLDNLNKEQCHLAYNKINQFLSSY